MPYEVYTVEGRECVYKKGPNGRMGRSLGCHDSKRQGYQQIAAIEANESKSKEYDEVGSEREYALSAVVRGFVREGRYDNALMTMEYIQSHGVKVHLYTSLAEAMYESKDDRVDEMFTKARQEARMIEDELSRTYALSDIVYRLVWCDRVDMALEVALSIGGEMSKSLIKTLYKAVVGEPEVPKNTVKIKEDADGNVWLIGIYSNKWEDRQKEILSEASHLDYVKWVKEKGFKPVITLYHQPKMRPGFWATTMKAFDDGRISADAMNSLVESAFSQYSIAQVEGVFYENGFAGVIAKVYDHRKDAIKKIAKDNYDLGMSHGFTLIEMNDNIYTKYRSFEQTLLMRGRAANVNTAIYISEETNVGPDEEKLLKEVLSEDEFDNLKKTLAFKAEELDASGIAFKGDEEGEDVKTADEPEVEVEEDKQEPEGKKANVEELALALGLPELQDILAERFREYDEQIEALKAEIVTLRKSEDEKIADQYRPTFAWNNIQRPSQMQENVKETDGKEKSDAKATAWVAENAWGNLSKKN